MPVDFQCCTVNNVSVGRSGAAADVWLRHGPCSDLAQGSRKAALGARGERGSSLLAGFLAAALRPLQLVVFRDVVAVSACRAAETRPGLEAGPTAMGRVSAHRATGQDTADGRRRVSELPLVMCPN